MNYKLRKAIEKQESYDWDCPIFDSDNPLPCSQRELKQILIDCRRMGISKICTSERTPYTIDILSAIQSMCHQSFDIENVPYRVVPDSMTGKNVYITQPGFLIEIR